MSASGFLDQMGVRQFRQTDLCSYVLWDQNSREAVIVDSCLEQMSDYRSFIAECGLKLTLAVDTRLHQDRLSATHLLRAEYGVKICMSARTSSLRPDRKLTDGEILPIGRQGLHVFETPGQSVDGIALYMEGAVFTGQGLPLGGRSPFFSQADVPTLLKSWREKLLKLPPETLVFSSRGGDLLFSTIAHEQERNPFLRKLSPDAFEGLLEGQAALPRVRSDSDCEACLRFNREASPSSIPLLDPVEGHCAQESFLSISAPKLARKMEKSDPEAVLIDVREPDEFRSGHIPGSMSLPVSELPFRFRELALFRRIYVTSLSGVRGDWRGPAATRTLSYLGVGDIVAVEGGVRGWAQQGYRLDSLPIRGVAPKNTI